jgi:hypothetical protein
LAERADGTALRGKSHEPEAIGAWSTGAHLGELGSYSPTAPVSGALTEGAAGMPLETADKWQADSEVEGWMLDKLKDTSPPGQVKDCLEDKEWSQIYELYCKRNLVTENFDYLLAVKDYRSNPSLDKANEIYDEFIPEAANTQINISSAQRRKLEEWHQDEMRVPTADMFEETFAAIANLAQSDSYTRFIGHSSETQKGLLAQEAEIRKKFEGDENISKPVVQEFDLSKIDRAVVDEWNKNALKELTAVGQSVAFTQYGDLVIIEHPTGSAVQPYLAWVKTQDWYDERSGTITLQAKGGAFSSGTLKIVDSSDKSKFETTVRKATKAKFVF